MLQLPSQSVVVVLGTRPEIVKLAPVIRLLGPAGVVVHTDQHYDAESIGRLLSTRWGCRNPVITFDVGGRSRGAQIGETVTRLSGLPPTGAGPALGDRSGGYQHHPGRGPCGQRERTCPLRILKRDCGASDRAMPEEHNRVVCGSSWRTGCALPTEVNLANLGREGIPPHRVELTGNTVVEALLASQPSSDEVSRILRDHDIPSEFVLATIHRPENVDEREPLERILRSLSEVPVPVVLPLHPRTKAAVGRFGLSKYLDSLMTLEPLAYRTFLALLSAAILVVSDSGGIQEEVSVLKKPLVVVRNSTERPEVEGTFAVRVAPGESIKKEIVLWLEDEPRRLALRDQPSPYGDGQTALRIVTGLEERVSA